MSRSSRKNSVRLKVCGLKHGHNLQEVVQAGVDMVGLIFYPPSPRYMADSLQPDETKSLPPDIIKVGVFVNQDFDEVVDFAHRYQLDMLQLHGDESPQICQRFREKGWKVIKAFGVRGNFDSNGLRPYHGKVDFFLFDTKTPQHGGSGQSFNWQILKEYPFDVPFLVGGGLGVENLPDLLALDLPHLFAVDMNSRLEIAPGLKDVAKVQEASNLLASK